MAISIANIRETGEGLIDLARSNPLATGGIIAGSTALVGGGLVVASTIRKKRKARTTRKRKATTKKRKTTKRRYPSSSYRRPAKRKRWYGKTKSKKIKYTKKGQPYVILSSGKARFIKKGRAKVMRKKKGGYH